MIKKLIFLFFISLFCLKSFGQNVITGRVWDAEDKEPLCGVSILLRDAAQKILLFTSSDIEGNFTLKTDLKATTVEFSMVGYTKQSMPLSKFTNKSMIYLHPSSEQLKNINVTSSQIKEQGDTITYYVASFAKKQDKTIGDVLKRMPGLTVEESGKIQYQGADINRFYIEGMDMLGGKYGIATNGISANDIGAVEVMENHQPLQVLGGIAFSDQAAVNLKLKSGAQSVWLVNGMIGGGVSESTNEGLWSGNIFAMVAKPRFQSIMNFKSNNIGIDFSPEVKDFLTENRFTNLPEYFNFNSIIGDSFENSRQRFNVSNLLSFNSIKTISNEYTVKSHIDYLYNRVRSQQDKTITYFGDESSLTLYEMQSGRNREHGLNSQVAITTNKRSFYLDNTFKLSLNWDKTEFVTKGSSENAQFIKQSDIFLDNVFSIIKRKKSHLIRLDSHTQYENHPQSFVVMRDETFGQKLKMYAFFNEEKTSYRIQKRGWRFSVEGGLRFYLSKLDALGSEDNINNMTFVSERNYASFFINPRSEKSFSKIDLQLDMPLSYNYYSLEGELGNHSIFLFNPSLKLRWNAPYNINVSISGATSNNVPNLDNLYAGMIATDYHTFNEGLYVLKLMNRKRISADVRFRNVSRGLFANAMVMMSWNKSPYIRSRNIDGENIIYGYTEGKSMMKMVTTSCNISKTMPLLHGGLSINGFYTWLWRDMSTQARLSSFVNDQLTANAKVFSSPCKYLYLQYQFKFNYSSLNQNYIDSKSTNFTNNIQVSIYPYEKLYIDLIGDFYKSELIGSTKHNMAILDAKATYKISSKLECNLSVTNILNNKSVTSTTFGLLNSSTTSNYIRGREYLLSLYYKL